MKLTTLFAAAALAAFPTHAAYYSGLESEDLYARDVDSYDAVLEARSNLYARDIEPKLYTRDYSLACGACLIRCKAGIGVAVKTGG